MDYLETLMRYKQWANNLLYASVKNLSREQLIAPRPIVFGSILRTLNHTYAMDVVWQSNLQRKNHGYTTRNPEDCPSLEELIDTQHVIDSWYVSYTASLSETDCNEVVEFNFIGGGAGSMTRRDILLHVVNHGTYHRGNVTGMMYDCGVMPPTTDYPVFLKNGITESV